MAVWACRCSSRWQGCRGSAAEHWPAADLGACAVLSLAAACRPHFLPCSCTHRQVPARGGGVLSGRAPRPASLSVGRAGRVAGQRKRRAGGWVPPRRLQAAPLGMPGPIGMACLCSGMAWQLQRTGTLACFSAARLLAVPSQPAGTTSADSLLTRCDPCRLAAIEQRIDWTQNACAAAERQRAEATKVRGLQAGRQHVFVVHSWLT